ncbi:5-methyltetrahydropteroyltriglutamate--homocysteine methyltransferase [Leptotrichia sp. OH3620_COT-345]|nr:5-methyltetrahydropteroyltriglutamate--homocysteine methyltransferase [Leptotrichia sp. OH3620_COT-345]
MKNIFKPFSTTLIGSMPRSEELLQLKEKSIKDSYYCNKYKEKMFSETETVINMLQDVGIDIIISGELSRDNYMSYVAERVSGIKLMTMENIKEITGNTDDFNKSLEEMDAADNSMNSPVCTGKISTDTKLNIEEVDMIKSITDKPFKMTLPSPYLLTRSMWLKEVTGKVYENRKELGNDVVKLLINEIRRLVSVGVKIIQIDEPILSEVVFMRQSGDNSFY